MPAEGSKVVLAVIADVHTCLTPPVFRSSEPDWFAAQARPWREVRKLCKKHDCPLAICGDLFDRWDARPEVVNWLMGQLPRKQKVYAVPGNHDLPNHDIQQTDRTAFGTLYRTKRIGWLGQEPDEFSPGRWLVGFGQGQSLGPPHAFPADEAAMTVAIVHDYCWDTGHSFPDAPKDKHWSSHLKAADGNYSVICFGDNHKGFVVQDNSRCIVNCGGLLIRNSDEVERRPFVTLVHANGMVSQHFLDTSEDVYEDKDVKELVNYGIDEETANEMIAAAKGLGALFVDFKQVVFNLAKSKSTRTVVIDFLKRLMEKSEDEK